MLARGGERGGARVRYRPMHWSIADRAVAISAAVAALGFLWRQAVGSHPAFNPYPEITMPPLDPWMVLFLALLLAPAAIAPAFGGRP